MNGALFNEVAMFLSFIPSKIMLAIQILNPFYATQPITIPLKIIRVTEYFNIIKPTWEEYQDLDTLKIELMVEAPSWDPSSPQFSRQEQNMLNCKG